MFFWRKILEKSSLFRFFGEKFWNILSYFQKIVNQIFLDFGQNGWLYMIFCKIKEKNCLPNWKNWVGRARRTRFSFFVALPQVELNFN